MLSRDATLSSSEIVPPAPPLLSEASTVPQSAISEPPTETTPASKSQWQIFEPFPPPRDLGNYSPFYDPNVQHDLRSSGDTASFSLKPTLLLDGIPGSGPAPALNLTADEFHSSKYTRCCNKCRPAQSTSMSWGSRPFFAPPIIGNTTINQTHNHPLSPQ